MRGCRRIALAGILVLAACQGRAPADGKFTQAEIEAVRRQVAGCWLLDVGMAGLEEMSVEATATFDPDGTVKSVSWETPDRYEGNRNYQMFAESARDAILRCSPLDLPPEEYAMWKRMTFSFSAREMLGL